ncbi:MAG: hypothetical protein QXP72_01845 [Desulfurococcaceae archaeon]
MSFDQADAVYRCGRCRREIKASELRIFGRRIRCPHCGPEEVSKDPKIKFSEKESEIIYKVAVNYRVVRAI